jgi:hypothetical protein
LTKRALMLSAAITALVAGPAAADTTISNKVTMPQNTETDGSILITSSGAVIISTSPPTAAALTIHSDNALVNNEGLISYKDVSGATAVELTTGYSGDFQSTGKIDLTGTGDDKTGILISGIPGDINSGTFTGIIPSGGKRLVAINLASGSTTSLQGDNSIGISQLSGTNIVGDIDIGGSLSVEPTSLTSTNASSGHPLAINLAGTMTGNLDIETGGIVQATGEGAEGVQILGTLSGAVINNGTIESAGTLRANPNNSNEPQAGSALLIGGSITGGIYNAGPSTVSDTTTVRGLISTGGNAPTILINPTLANGSPTGNLVIGFYSDPTDSGYSFLNRGTISGASINADVPVTTFSIVGASSTAETIFQGGLFNGGSITAAATTNTKASSVTANALYIGDYAMVPEINNSNESASGSINATVTGPESGSAYAIWIAPLANYCPTGSATCPMMSLDNSGSITAVATTTNPDFVGGLTAYAIYDQSGTLNSITNSGTIEATATTLKNNSQIAIAADLTLNTTGVTFTNTGTVDGSILFGSGNDTLNVTGSAQVPATVNGNINFGGCNSSSGNGDDTLIIGEFASVTGAVTEKLGCHVDVSIAQGGTLNLENTPANLGSNVVGLYAGAFDMAPGSNLGLVVSQSFNLSINPQSGAMIDALNADIGNDSAFKISFGSYIGNFQPGKGILGSPTATFDLLSAPVGSLVISGSELQTIETDFATTIPFLFTGDLCTWNINGNSTCKGGNPGQSELVLNLTPKSPQQLGLTGYALKMFPYANEALAYDSELGAAMLNDIQNAQQAQSAYAAFAPDVSGANRALAISLTDEATNVVAARQRALREYANQDGDLTLWTQQFVERLNQDNTADGSGFTDSGFGFTLGADEGDAADGRYGGAFTFFSGGMDAKAPVLQKTNSEWYMATGYTDWHGSVFFLDTQATVGYAHLTGSRTINLSGFSRTANNTRPAEYLAGGATAGLQYDVLGAAVMPQISFDGLAMRQEGYTEEGGGGQGGDGFDLHVEPDYAASLRAFTGVDARDDLNLGDFLLQPEARAGYRYDFANGQENAKVNFADVQPLTQFEVSGPKPAHGNALAGAGMGVSTGAWSIQFGVDYLYANSGNTSEEGTLTLLGRF